MAERERLNAEARSEIARLMREKKVTRSGLARLLGVSRVCVTQMFEPSRDMKLATLEKVVRKLGYTVHLECAPQLTSRYRDDE